jgi:hypothetical protein
LHEEFFVVAWIAAAFVGLYLERNSRFSTDRHWLLAAAFIATSCPLSLKQQLADPYGTRILALRRKAMPPPIIWRY